MMYHQGSNSDHFAMQNQAGDGKRVTMPNAHMEEWNQMFPGGGNFFPGYDSQQDVKNDNHEGQNGYYIPPTSLGGNADGRLVTK